MAPSTRLLLLLWLFWLPHLPAQAPAKPDPAKTDPAKTDAPKPDSPKTDSAKPPAPLNLSDWQTKSFEVKYADPEELRDFFSGRSVVMEASRQLKILTVHGPASFIKEVEDIVKRFDVPPPPAANIQVTVYLLAASAQAPSGLAVPAELSALSKEFGTPAPKLADSQIFRVREGQSGQAVSLSSKPESASLSRVWLQSAVVTLGPKGDRVSLYGLRVWVAIPSTGAPGVASPPQSADPDVAANVDIEPNQAVMVSKVGVEQPVIVVVRATVIR